MVARLHLSTSQKSVLVGFNRVKVIDAPSGCPCAYDAGDLPEASSQDPTDHGPAWVRAFLSGESYDIDDLRQQALRVAYTSISHLLDNKPHEKKSKTFARLWVQAACHDEVGLHCTSSMAYILAILQDYWRTASVGLADPFQPLCDQGPNCHKAAFT